MWCFLSLPKMLFLLLTVTIPLGAVAGVLVLESTADTVLTEQQPDLNLGGMDTLSVESGYYDEHTLIAFDLSELSIEARDIQSAQLAVDVIYYPQSQSSHKGSKGYKEHGHHKGHERHEEHDRHECKGSSHRGHKGSKGNSSEITLHSIIETWNEMDATWNCNALTNCSGSWQGGDYKSAPIDRIKGKDISNGTIQFDVSKEVKEIVNGRLNYGWLIKKKNSSKGIITFSSKEGSVKKGTKSPRLILSLKTSGDVAPPTVEIIAYPNNLLIAGSAVFNVNFTDDKGIDAASTLITFDGQNINSSCVITASFAQCSLLSTNTGVHKITAEVQDFAGKKGTDNSSFLYLQESLSHNQFISTWHKGIGSPYIEKGRDTDLYLDAFSGDVYKKQNGEWLYSTNIVGKTGVFGFNGATGDKGSSGDQGAKGEGGQVGGEGIQGFIGQRGSLGDQGMQGLAGLHGATGGKGVAGISYYASRNCPAGKALFGFDGLGEIVCR